MRWGRFDRIGTARLVLKPACAADLPALIAALGNYDVARWLGRVPYPCTPDTAQAFLADSARRGGRVWFVHDAEGLAGGVSIEDELAFWLRRDRWGRGYATEAAAAVLPAHFARLAAGDVVSLHMAGNERSARVLEKLGFRPAGRRRVMVRALGQEVEGIEHRLTRAAWRRARPARPLPLSLPRLWATAARAGGRA